MITDANAAAATLLGHDQRRLPGKPLAAMIDLADRREFRRRLLRLEQGGPDHLRVRVGDTELDLTLRVLPRLTPRVVVASLAADRPPRPAPPPQQQQQHVLERVLLRTPVAAVSFDRDRRITFANQHARRLIGADAVRHGAPFDGGPLRELAPLIERLARLAAPLRPTVLQLADGRALRAFGSPATAVEDAVLFVEDVSDELQHERVMREFLRNAAHQLRTPLAGITAAIETLQGGAKERPAERDRFLAHLATHAGRLSRIARGLLLLARAEAGEALAVDVVELRPLVEGIVGEAKPRDGVTLRAWCPPGLAAFATPDLLHEAVAALVDNAVSHTHEGEITVNATRADRRILVSVTDAGAGILPEFQDRVFEPFFRVTPTGEGYGLGLAIAAQAVRAMRGTIGVSSVLGVGTTFTVSLPSATEAR